MSTKRNLNGFSEYASLKLKNFKCGFIHSWENKHSFYVSFSTERRTIFPNHFTTAFINEGAGLCRLAKSDLDNELIVGDFFMK